MAHNASALAKVIFAAAAFAVMSVSPAAHATTFVYKTDTSWKLVGSLNPAAAPPAAGWNSTATFDDSSWAAATIVVPESPGNVPVTPFLWDATGWQGATQVIWTRKVIPVSAPVVSAVLDVGCDDDMQVYVNGTQVVNDNDGSATSILGIDIAPQLVQGDNVVAARCVNVQPSFHAFGAIVTLSLDVRAVQVPTLSAGALAFLALVLALSVSFAPRRR